MWCGVARCCVVLCCVVWCGVVWCGVVWCGVVWFVCACVCILLCHGCSHMLVRLRGRRITYQKNIPLYTFQNIQWRFLLRRFLYLFSSFCFIAFQAVERFWYWTFKKLCSSGGSSSSTNSVAKALLPFMAYLQAQPRSGEVKGQCHLREGVANMPLEKKKDI